LNQRPLGGLFGLLDAPFIAVVQIIIYASAILVLFYFVIVIINLRRGLPPEKILQGYHLLF